MSITGKAHAFDFGRAFHGYSYQRMDGGGPLRCSYCGSLSPSDAARMIRAGSGVEWADRKYGWPHKVYLTEPWGKFYTVHLQDATPEDAEVIQRAMGYRFKFDDNGTVRWEVYAALAPQEDDGDVA